MLAAVDHEGFFGTVPEPQQDIFFFFFFLRCDLIKNVGATALALQCSSQNKYSVPLIEE